MTLLNLPAFEKAAVIRRNFPKVCNSCKRVHTFKQWTRLANPRPWAFPWGEVQELRECECMSTLSIVVQEGEPDEGLGETPERRAPVQGDGHYHLRPGDLRRANAHDPGTVAWSEHEEAWEAYAKRFGRQQSAERLAERGGFSYWELVDQLGHKPKTWRPR